MSKKSKRSHAAAKQPSVGQAKNESVSSAGGGLRSVTGWMIILVLILPVIFSNETMDPTLMPRYIFLGSFMIVFLLFYFLYRKTAFNFSYPLLIKMVFICGAAFCVWSMVSLFFAVNPVEGYYEVLRQMLNILLLYLVMLMVQQGGLNVLSLAKALVLVSAFHAFVGILQYYEIAFTELPAGVHELPYGLMSNRNLFGSAQALLLPFSLYVLYKGSRNWKIVAALALSAVMVSILLSQTRSAWLSTIAVIVIPLLLVMIFSAANRKKWLIGTVAGTAISAALVLLVLKTDTEGSLSASVSQRAASLTGTKADSSTIVAENINERLMVWKKTIAMIKDHPVTGVGYGNWKIIVPAYGTEGLVWAKGKTIPDRPHNVYLQVAAETGLPGAILYFGIWGLIVLAACKIILRPASEDQRVLAIVMLSGLAAFAIDCMFSFPVERIEHSLYIVLTGAIILGSYNKAQPSNPAYPAYPAYRQAGGRQAQTSNFKLQTSKPFNKTALIFSMLLVILNIFIGYKKLNYEVHMNYAKAYEDKQRYQEELAEVAGGQSSLVNMDPNGSPIEVRAGIAYRGLKDHDKAIDAFDRAKKKNPNSAMVYNNLGTVYTEMKDYNKAIENYRRALKLAPEFDIVIKNLAVNYFDVEKYDSCIIMLGKIRIGEDEYLKNLLNEAGRRMALQKK